MISIHALLAESDLRIYVTVYMDKCYFYPRSPCGERLRQFRGVFLVGDFYPRSPCGERLNDAINGCNPDFISIHALLAESDDTSKDVIKTTANFYPRSPCGERR